MHDSGLMQQAFVFLLSAVVAVPVAKRLGLGSVLGYLCAGAVIGPFALGLIGNDVEGVMAFAEFGVVMMLFLVGLELDPSLLWRMRVPILGLGGLQVVVTSVLILLVGVQLGFPWQCFKESDTCLSIEQIREQVRVNMGVEIDKPCLRQFSSLPHLDGCHLPD